MKSFGTTGWGKVELLLGIEQTFSSCFLKWSFIFLFYGSECFVCMYISVHEVQKRVLEMSLFQ